MDTIKCRIEHRIFTYTTAGTPVLNLSVIDERHKIQVKAAAWGKIAEKLQEDIIAGNKALVLIGYWKTKVVGHGLKKRTFKQFIIKDYQKLKEGGKL